MFSINDFRDRFTESHAAWALACLALLLLAPLGVSRSSEKPLALGLPGVREGDEPHYLVLINSVVSDGDFDLANNYRNVHRGGQDAGRMWSGHALDHHVNWYHDGRIVKWWQAYEREEEKWEKDDTGHPVPTLLPDSRFWPVSATEFSQHSVGLAVLLSPILFPFRGTSLVEPIALLCSGLATVGGCLAWYWLVKPYAKSPANRLAALAVAYLGSPLWHYGLVLFTESFLAFFSIAAFALALRAQRYLLAGLLLGAGTLIKSPFALIALPLLGDAVLRRQWRQALACALPVAMSGCLILHWNRQMYGDWLNNPQEWEAGPLREGLYGLTLSWEHGVLLVSPALLLSALMLPKWFRRHVRDATLMTLATVLYGGLMASWAQWWGGTCYSARLIVPIFPFLFAPLPLFFESRMWETSVVVRRAGTAVAIVSIALGAIAAFGCDYVWVKHPLELFR